MRLAQVRRMLRDSRSKAFTEGFSEAWLRLDKLGAMPPDSKAFYRYYKDRLEGAMRAETYAYVRHFFTDNLPVRQMLDSNFTFVNENLANHYGLTGVLGPELRKVKLPANSRRGGLLGQASILTLTANGVETSPVVRGIWVLENILGTPPSPPPPDVEPLEPDRRGAASIRDQLRKHRDVETCRDCHQKIDPLGFPLEYYDPIGRFRESYYKGRLAKTSKIDGHGELSSGETFKDERDLKRVLLQRERQFARTIVHKLLTYATGRPMNYRDEPAINAILNQAREDDYRLHDLLLGVVSCEVFAAK